MLFTTTEWVRYGFTVDDLRNTEGIAAHNLVCFYLKRHPDIAAEFIEPLNPDRGGRHTYLDVLAMAEKERDRDGLLERRQEREREGT